MDAVNSVYRAWDRPGAFTSLVVRPIDDTDGKGRSQARNKGLAEKTDWHFLLDADDTMVEDAFTLNDWDAPATFGAVTLNGNLSKDNIFPCSWETLFDSGALGTLSMGCFVRGDLGLRFDERMDAGEDFDFFMRLPGFTKVKEPLVSIGYDVTGARSAKGPRGHKRIDWVQCCNEIIQQYAP